MGIDAEQAMERLNDLFAKGDLELLSSDEAQKFGSYFTLLLLWNAKMNLTAVRDQEGILSRHFVECIACARRLPVGICSLLDLGSGAGFPGIPIALCRPEIKVTLAESQGKKAAFLNEAVRQLGINADVYACRAEQIKHRFDCVILRAVDKMAEAVQSAAYLVNPKGWLALMTTRSDVADLQRSAGAGFCWDESIPLPASDTRILALGYRGQPEPQNAGTSLSAL